MKKHNKSAFLTQSGVIAALYVVLTLLAKAMGLRPNTAAVKLRRLREKLKIVLMGCEHSFDNCFCVSMDTNCADTYHMAVNMERDGFHIDCKDAAWNEHFLTQGYKRQFVAPNQEPLIWH